MTINSSIIRVVLAVVILITSTASFPDEGEKPYGECTANERAAGSKDCYLCTDEEAEANPEKCYEEEGESVDGDGECTDEEYENDSEDCYIEIEVRNV